MPDGIDVRPEDLHEGAGRLRDDAGRLAAGTASAVHAATVAAGAAGDGPLEGAANALAARLDTLLRAVAGSMTDCADALDAASTRYLAADRGAAAAVDVAGAGPEGDTRSGPPIVLPGLEPPR